MPACGGPVKKLGLICSCQARGTEKWKQDRFLIFSVPDFSVETAVVRPLSCSRRGHSGNRGRLLRGVLHRGGELQLLLAAHFLRRRP